MWQYFSYVGFFDHVVNIGNILSNYFLIDLTIQYRGFPFPSSSYNLCCTLILYGSRSSWQGSISFGLVTIPVKLYTATNKKEYVFNQLCKNGHRIRYKKWCPVEDREVDYSEIKKGYEKIKDNYIVFEKDELQKIKLKTTKSVDIKEFIDFRELNPIFIQDSYYVATDPKAGNAKPYALLVKILNDNNMVAIGKVILKDKESLVALRPYQRGLVMHILNYLDELRPVEDIPEMGVKKIKLIHKRYP